MRLGKIAAVLLLAVGALLAPTTAAQAASASCAPTEQDRWLGTYSGPHYKQDGELFGVLEISVFVKNGQLMTKRQTMSTRSELASGLLKTTGGMYQSFQSKSATCDGNGTVTDFAGNWQWNLHPEVCPVLCFVSGTFEATRI